MADKPIERPMDRYLRRPSGDADGAKDGSFESGESPAFMLDLVLANGDRVALPYCYLNRVKLEANGKLTLDFSGRSVVIGGRNLGPLYNHLSRHQVWRIAAATSAFDDNSNATWVKTIDITEADDPYG